jgi:5'-nucleotidase
MKILVTNDDGIFAEGLWTLVKELKNIARVVVVAPDREQSAVGTAVTLWQPLRVRKVNPTVPEVEAYAVEGTPSDSVMLAFGSLVKDKLDLVISGINQGLNLGDDVHISGTVSAALQGYLHGLPSLAISIARGDKLHLDSAAKFAARLAPRIITSSLPSPIFLNINLPNLPLAEIGRAQITRLTHDSHINTIEEGHDGKREYYWLVRQRRNHIAEPNTDVWAIEKGNISVTPLLTDQTSDLSAILESLCSELLQELKSGGGTF